jgi:hypothetical protein
LKKALFSNHSQPLPEIQDKENHFAEVKINYWATSGLSFILQQKHRLHQLLKKSFTQQSLATASGKAEQVKPLCRIDYGLGFNADQIES